MAAIARVVPHPGQRYPVMFVNTHRLCPFSNVSRSTVASQIPIPNARIQTSNVRTDLVFLEERIALSVTVIACDDLDQIYQSPDAATTTGEQLDDTDRCVAGIETVNTQATQENAKQQRGEPVLLFAVIHAGIGLGTLFANSASATHTHYRAGANLVAAVVTEVLGSAGLEATGHTSHRVWIDLVSAI